MYALLLRDAGQCLIVLSAIVLRALRVTRADLVSRLVASPTMTALRMRLAIQSIEFADQFANLPLVPHEPIVAALTISPSVPVHLVLEAIHMSAVARVTHSSISLYLSCLFLTLLTNYLCNSL